MCLSEACYFSDLTRLSYSYGTHALRFICVCVCQHGDLKTGDILLVGSYVDWRKISKFACQNHRSKLRSFSEGSRSLGKVMSYSVPFPMVSFLAERHFDTA